MSRPLSTVGDVVTDILSGKSTQTLERPAVGNEFGILKVSAVTWGEFRPSENKAMPSNYDPGRCPRPMDGDILISRANTRELVGAPVMVKGDFPQLLLSDKLLKLVPDKSIVDHRYLLRALRSPAALSHFYLCAGGSSGSMTNITQSDIRATPIYLPTLPEQRRIAAILDHADGLRAKRRVALAQLDRLTQSIFIEMFGDLATNPKRWPIVALRELGKVTTGRTPPGDQEGMFDGPIPFITPGDLESGRPPKRSVTDAGAAEIVKVRAGATFVCCIGTIGKIGVATTVSTFNQQINAVEWTEKVSDAYGAEALRFFKPTIIAWGASTTVPILKKSAFERLEIPVPPIALQLDFEDRISVVQKIAEASKSAMVELDELFQSLQSKAFRGEL